MRPVRNPLLTLPRHWKRIIVVSIDVMICILTVWVAYYLRLGAWVSMYGRPSLAALASLALALPVFALTGMYRIVLRHAGADALGRSAVACSIYGLAFATLISAYGIVGVPRTIGFIQPGLLFLGVSASRFGAAFVLSGRYRKLHRDDTRRRALIYGAGSSGQQLAAAMGNSRELRIIGFLDDDRSLHHSRVRGVPVLDPGKLEDHVTRHRIDDILLALPSASRARRNAIITDLKRLDVNVRTLPGLMDLAHGTIQATDLRALTIDDLLGREPVPTDPAALHQHITGQTIMVTGAGGSIGSELCRQLFAMAPARLLLVDSSEYALYAIHRELSAAGHDVTVPLLGSVIDRARIASIMATWRPAMVFHAAAYKHVPLVEHNVLQGIRNNVLGTLIVAEEARRNHVRDFVLVSTDKAVRPTNVMGATKRLAEMVLQGLAAEGRDATCFSMVRFGNVLGSSGSVVPLFREQIQRGGPITLTHRNMTRYFMTIPEAANLVLQASTMAAGGEVFVLDMGEPVHIYDLACNLIQLSGLSVCDEARPDGDIAIVTVGLRPGEKLYEELLIGDNPVVTRHPRIMMANEPLVPLVELYPALRRMETLIEAGDVAGARDLLCALVPEYVSSERLVDHVARARAGSVDADVVPLRAARARG